MRRALLIAGPTASGKSAAALALAKAFGATIVNADSMQVYADLSVLTARPTARGGGERPAPPVRRDRRRDHLFGGLMVAQGAGDSRRNRRRAGHFRRRHRSLFPCADGRPVRHAGGAGSRSRRDPRQGRGPRDRGAARRARGARPGDGGAPETLGPPADLARARSVRRDRPAARFVPGGARGAGAAIRANGRACSSRRTARRSTGASTPASTRC